MKIFLAKLFVSLAIIIGMIVLLNVEVTTRQGINYQWKTIKIPLYLKLLDFFDRHYNYKNLVKKITPAAGTDTERALSIFTWTINNIRRVPEGMPVVDDHVWYIIVRGYGAADQSSDVFTTLCNYSGLNAFYMLIGNAPGKILLSVVSIGKEWTLFDPHNGVYFVNAAGGLATFSDIELGDWKAINIKTSADSGVNYKPYLTDLPKIKEGIMLRPQMQSPLKRFLFEIRKLKLKRD